MLAEYSPATENVDANGECRKLLEQIQVAIEAGDLSTIRHTADALKGPITSVFANEAFAAAATLENTLHECDLVLAQDACRRLRALVNSLNPTSKQDS
jgi:HPt (histidine-containing phosphotransfer) domain-containing protein